MSEPSATPPGTGAAPGARDDDFLAAFSRLVARAQDQQQQRGASRFRKFGATVTIAPFLVLVATIGRLYVVSGYDTTTALGLASAAGLASTLTGSLLPPLVALLPLLTLGTTAGAILSTLVGAFALAGRLLVSAAACFAGTILTTPTSVNLEAAVRLLAANTALMWRLAGTLDYAPAALTVAVIALYAGARTRRVVRETRATQGDFALLLRGDLTPTIGERSLAIFAVGGAALYLFTVTTLAVYPSPPTEIDRLPATFARLWLPAEEITTSDGRRRIGYSLSTEGNWSAILLEAPRRIDLVRSDTVMSRTRCGAISDPVGVPLLATTQMPIRVAPCGRSQP